MPVLGEPLPPDVIRTFKGTLDYYVYRGLYVIRKWPRKSSIPQTAASAATARDFGDNAAAFSQLPAEFLAQSQELASGTGWTWRDLWTAAIYGNQVTYESAQEPQPSQEVPDMLPHQLNRYYSHPATGATLSSATLSASVLRFCPIVIPFLGTYDRIALEQAGAGTFNYRLGVYGPILGALEGAPLQHETAVINRVGAGVVEEGMALELVPGWYILAAVWDGTPSVRVITLTNLTAQYGSDAMTNQPPRTLATVAHAFGPLPATIPAGLSYTLANVPWLALRKA